MWDALMDELREVHLGQRKHRRAGPSVSQTLQAAYEAVVAKKRR
jgi:hypothetical protein